MMLGSNNQRKQANSLKPNTEDKHNLNKAKPCLK